MPRRVLGYARVSSLEQALGTSLADQQRSIAANVAARGIDPTAITFFVEAESGVGEKLERRVQMTALMKAVGKGDLVVCDKLDRWSRDTEHTLRSVREIREAGATFVAVHERYDSSTSDGDLMLTIRAALAKEEHARIKLRMVGTRRLVRDKGYYVEGTPPLGYRRAHPKGYKGIEKNVLAIVPDEAALVRRIFHLYVGGKSMTAIATRLDLKLDRVKDALHRRIYTGEVQDSRGAWIKGHHEAIVDVDLFVRAQDIIAERTLGGRRPHPVPCETSGWILRDVARCGACGAKASAAYAGPKGEGRRHYYRCSKRCTSVYAPVKEAEASVTTWVVGRLEELGAQIKAAATKRPTAARDVGDTTDRRAKLARRRVRYVEAFADEALTRDEFRAKMKKLDEERLRLDAEDAATSSGLADAVVRRELVTTLADIRRAWGRAVPEGKRTIVNALMRTVDVVGVVGSPGIVWRDAEDLSRSMPALVDAIEAALAHGSEPPDEDESTEEDMVNALG